MRNISKDVIRETSIEELYWVTGADRRVILEEQYVKQRA
jgi:hypothetical protein